jgi:hypothetical protein
MRERELFDAVVLSSYRVLHQMSPDLTIAFSDEAAASRAKPMLGGFFVSAGRPLFKVGQRGHQLFCQLLMREVCSEGPRACPLRTPNGLT